MFFSRLSMTWQQPKTIVRQFLGRGVVDGYTIQHIKYLGTIRTHSSPSILPLFSAVAHAIQPITASSNPILESGHSLSPYRAEPFQ